MFSIKLFNKKQFDKKGSVKDASFSNLFFKRFIVHLFVLLLISGLGIKFAQVIVTSAIQHNIQNVVYSTALELAQLEDTDMEDKMMQTSANILLANAHKELVDNPFIIDSSLSFYNMSGKKTIAKSYEIPVLLSEDAVSWWRKQANVTDGFPKFVINDEMREFYFSHAKDDIYIEEMRCVNYVLFPSKMVAKDEDGTVIAECVSNVPSAGTAKYQRASQFAILGNRQGDAIYEIMSDSSIKTQTADGKTAKINVVNYQNESFENIDLISNQFTINKINYQVDCGYKISFWAGAWLYVLIIELLCILLCAVSALINTKETLSIYY